MIKNQKIRLSFCIPVFNEQAVIEKSLSKIDDNLKKLLKNEEFEILIANNGSTDKTRKILRRIKNKRLKIFDLSQKGQGSAYRYCMQKSRGELIALSAIDLPFGFSDLKKALSLPEFDIIFASKKHPKSKVNIPLKRRIASNIYNMILFLLFKNKIKDTQGTIFVKQKVIKKLIKKCVAKDAFFTAQLAIYAQKYNYSICEIPVTYDYSKGRASKYSVITDGKKMLSSMIIEFLKSNSN